MNRQDQERVWAKRLRAHERSGKSVRQFCEEGGFSDATFYKWRQRLAAHADAGVHVELVELGGPQAAPFEISVGEVTVRVPAAFDDKALSRLLEVVRSGR